MHCMCLSAQWFMVDSVLLQALSHLNLIIILESRQDYYVHFRRESCGAGRLNDLSKSQSSVAEARLGARTSNTQPNTLSAISFHPTFLYRRTEVSERWISCYLVNTFYLNVVRLTYSWSTGYHIWNQFNAIYWGAWNIVHEQQIFVEWRNIQNPTYLWQHIWLSYKYDMERSTPNESQFLSWFSLSIIIMTWRKNPRM